VLEAAPHQTIIIVPQMVSVVGGGVSSELGIGRAPNSGPCACEILCAGAVNGDGQVAPVYMKVVRRITFAEQNTFEKRHLGSKLPLASWAPPGCLVLPGGLLGASWMLIGCLLHKKTCLLVQQEGKSSCPTRRRVFLFSKKTCLLVQQEDTSSCPSRGLVFLCNKKTSLLV